jgi:hypothetical protein
MLLDHMVGVHQQYGTYTNVDWKEVRAPCSVLRPAGAARLPPSHSQTGAWAQRRRADAARGHAAPAVSFMPPDAAHSADPFTPVAPTQVAVLLSEARDDRKMRQPNAVAEYFRKMCRAASIIHKHNNKTGARRGGGGGGVLGGRVGGACWGGALGGPTPRGRRT